MADAEMQKDGNNGEALLQSSPLQIQISPVTLPTPGTEIVLSVTN